jgi:hypothetical protein
MRMRCGLHFVVYQMSVVNVLFLQVASPYTTFCQETRSADRDVGGKCSCVEVIPVHGGASLLPDTRFRETETT